MKPFKALLIDLADKSFRTNRNHSFMSKCSIILLFIICLQHISSAQIPKKIDTKQKKFRELHISSLIGFSALGPKNDIENNMISSGLGDDSDSWFGNVDYPSSSKWPVIDLETTFYFRMKHGISANAAIIDYLYVSGNDYINSGYAGISFGNYIRLSSRLTSYSLNYAFRTSNNQLNFFIGPSYMVHWVEKEDGDIDDIDEYAENTNKKYGLYLGFVIHAIQKRHWFLAFKANMRLTSNSEIGPFIDGNESSSYTSEFSQVKVNLNTFNAGIVVGIRFHNQLY